MRSRATRRFWKRFAALPNDAQLLAKRNYRLWRENPAHPSLHFRPLRGHDNLFTIRIGDHYRALAEMESGDFTWIWIGTHAEYDQFISG
jgi:hypothetical protein